MTTGLMLDRSGCSPLMSHSCPELRMQCMVSFLFTTGYVSRTYNALLSSRWLRSMLYHVVQFSPKIHLFVLLFAE